MLGEWLFERLRNLLALGACRLDEAIDLKRDRLDERSVLPLPKYQSAGLNRVIEELRETSCVSLSAEISCQFYDGAPEVGVGDVEPVVNEDNLRSSDELSDGHFRPPLPA